MNQQITGTFVAIVTPFDEREEINEAALQRQVRRQAEAGNGVFCAGTNGEFYALSFAEKVRVAGLCVEAAAGQMPVLAHIGEISTHQTIALGREIDRLDVRAVSAITPSFIACSQDELIAHYHRIADAIAKPLYLYNIPARTGNTITPETARTLAAHPNIVGIKDSAGSQESLDGFLAVARERDDFEVLVGPDSLVLHGLRHGAAGSISGLGNVSPQTLQAIYREHRAGHDEAAATHQTRYSALRQALYAHGFPPTLVKCALRSVMPEVGRSRGPALLSAEVEAAVREIALQYAEAWR